MTNVRRIPAAELPDDLAVAWSRWRCADASLHKPFFAPDFTRVVGRHRDDVFVAVLEQDGCPAGVLPYQQSGGDRAEPVGGVLNDFQGAVTEAGLSWSPAELLARCGVKSYRFDHVPASQTALANFRWRQSDSPYVDLSGGFEAYSENRAQAGSRVVPETLRKMRKAEREVGPIRLEPFSDDPHVFETTIRWKREQYRRIGSVDHLRESWKRSVLHDIWRTHNEGFRGMLSALYIGDQLAATHLGMLSYGVLHCWFPTYSADDARLARYSPGMAFWVKLAQQAEALGVHRLDLGKGDESYKQRLMTGNTPLAEGCVDLRPVSSLVNRSWYGLREFVKRTPLRAPVQRALSGLRSWQRR